MPVALALVIADDLSRGEESASTAQGSTQGGLPPGDEGPSLTFVVSGSAGATSGYKKHNPEFLQLGYLRMLERFVSILGDHGLLVMLDVHVAEVILP